MFNMSLVTPFSRRLRDKLHVYQDLVIDTIVYLVSHEGLLVRTTTHKTVSLSLYLRCYFIKK